MKRFLAGLFVFIAIYWCSVWAQDAPMFRGDLQHTGVYSASRAPQLNGIKWKFHTGGRVISSPAVVDGVVYVGSTDGNAYAIDAVSGAQKWKFETKAWEVSSPAVVSGVVYFLSYDGHLYALDAATAEVKWKFATGAPTVLAAKVCLRMHREIDAELRSRPGHAFHVDVTIVLVHDQLCAR